MTVTIYEDNTCWIAEWFDEEGTSHELELEGATQTWVEQEAEGFFAARIGEEIQIELVPLVDLVGHVTKVVSYD